jgi:ATP-dependent Clp protease ATP-binding subunit ClpA
MREEVFEKYTSCARQVVATAEEEARARRHGHVGTEHLLLGLIAVHDAPLMLVLNRLGLEAGGIRDKVDEMRPLGLIRSSGHIPFTPEAKTAMQRSAIEAQLHGHSHIDAEHILWGLSRQTEAIATKALASLGATPEQIRQELLLTWGL